MAKKGEKAVPNWVSLFIVIIILLIVLIVSMGRNGQLQSPSLITGTPTGNAVLEAGNCQDSDGGVHDTIAGVVMFKRGTQNIVAEDKCIYGGRVVEGYCENGVAKFTTINCRCVSTPNAAEIGFCV